MRILHYSLGFPPYRTGGLTTFCIDLMKFQESRNIETCMMWPGRIKLFNSKIKVIKSIDKETKLKSYELVNPLPVPLDEGIKEISAFIKEVDKKIYIDILKEINPDYIHVHTLMGIHKDFFEAAKELKIKLIFTPHDYFGLCPKLTFYNDGKMCVKDLECKNCTKCNESALSIKKIYLMQKPIYRALKDSRCVKFLRKKHRENFFSKDIEDTCKIENDNYKDYKTLRNYYIDMIKLFDIIHFNSNLTKEVYSKYISVDNSKVINITHNEIRDNRTIKNFDEEKLRITYMGSAKPYKGFNLLIKSLDEIWDENIHEFVLNAFIDTNEKREYMNGKGQYNIKNLKEIFQTTDILILPSIWSETFGFTVLEAISYGVPVIISKNVGAKDIVKKAGIIIDTSNTNELKNAIKLVISNKEILKEMNKEAFNCKLPNMDNLLNLLEEKDEAI